MKTKLNVILAASAMVFGCIGVAGADPFVDDANTRVLLHMDERSAGGPFTTPDDDSANPGRGNDFLMYGKDDGGNDHYDPVITDAKFVTGQAGYGNAIHFDGVNDSLYGFTGTTYDDLGIASTDEVRIDLYAKLDMVKNGDDSLHSLIIQPNRYQILFYDRANDWRIDFRIWTDAGLQTVAITDVAKGVDVTQWNEYSLKWENGIVEGLINGVSVGTKVATGTVLDAALRDFHIGADHSQTKHWGGDVDELRISTIPEPSTLALLGVVGGAVLFVRRKYMR